VSASGHPTSGTRARRTYHAHPAAGSAEGALLAGQTALREGRRTEAIGWLDRAWRLAFGEPSAGISLASATMDDDPQWATEILQAVLNRYPSLREARVGLAAASFRSGDRPAAAARLGAMLGCMAPPRTRAFRSFADAVASAVDAPGWIGLNGAGQLTISRAECARVAEIEIDGMPCATVRGRRYAVHALDAGGLQGRRLAVSAGGRDLLGSPIMLAPFRHLSGIVRADPDGGASGCAWLPGDPDTAAVLTVTSGRTRAWLTARGEARLRGVSPAARHFRIPPASIRHDAGVRVCGPDGQDLCGSPLTPANWNDRRTRPLRRSARVPQLGDPEPGDPEPGVPEPGDPEPGDPELGDPELGDRAASPRCVPARAAVDVVMPVYRGADDVGACLASLLQALPADAGVIVVDDGSTDDALRAVLNAAAARGAVTVLRQDRNRGFPAAANVGLRLCRQRGRDAVLLNADTVLPPGCIGRLADAAYAAADIGSVTPMSHDGSIVSCAVGLAPGAVPSQAEVTRIDAWFAAANPARYTDLPTGVGFCMFMRHDCLEDVGVFREDLFAHGYGEENDWCLRARARGWRHLAAGDVFVAHLGGRSFGSDRSLLMDRNGPILARLHPGYHAEVRDFLRADPLRGHRQRAAVRRWAQGRCAQGAVILVTHDRGGGTQRRVGIRCAEIRAEAMRPIVLRLGCAAECRDLCLCQVCDGNDEFPDLRFELPQCTTALSDLLRADHAQWLELHHLAGFPPHVLDLARLLDIPYDIAIHDYASVCPRVTFLGVDERYCGEPTDTAVCARCVATAGTRLHESIAVDDLRARSARMLQQARTVTVPCAEVGRRIRRYFPDIAPAVTAWEGDALVRPMRPGPDALRPAGICVGVVGAIGEDKGYNVLLKCAEDAARRELTLRFVVIGHTIDDETLLATGRIFVTGQFDTEAEAIRLLRLHQVQLGFVSSVWPETWNYALSTLWRAGLPAAAFAIGAPAERIRRAGGSGLIPLGTSPAQINDMLLALGTRATASPPRIFAA